MNKLWTSAESRDLAFYTQGEECRDISIARIGGNRNNVLYDEMRGNKLTINYSENILFFFLKASFLVAHSC